MKADFTSGLRAALLVLGISVVTLSVGRSQSVPVAPTSSYLFDQNLSPLTGSLTGVMNGTVGYSASSTPFSYGGNSSLDFNSSGYVSVGSFSFGSSGTISVWAYDQIEAVAARYVFDSGGNRYLFNQAVGSDAYVDNRDIYDGPFIGAAGWTHLALTWTSAGAVSVYINGALVNSASVSAIAGSTQTLFIGSRKSAEEFWTGQIDEFATWDTTLSASNVSWLSTNSITSIPEPGSSAVTMAVLAVISVFWWRRRFPSARRSI